MCHTGRLRGRRATFREESSRFEETELASGTADLSPGDGDVWVICDPEDPDFGKSMDLRGQSYSLGDYGLADRARRPLITVPSLLSDSIVHRG